MANSPNKIGSAPGRTDCAALSASPCYVVSVTPALELLLRAKLLLVQAIGRTGMDLWQLPDSADAQP